MKIVIIRHGKVNYNWNKRYTSEGFDRACREYDDAPILEECYRIPDIAFQNIIISGLSRTCQTVRKLTPRNLRPPLLPEFRRSQSSMHPHRLLRPTKFCLKLGTESYGRNFRTVWRNTSENLHVNAEVKRTDLINEVPLYSSLDTKLRLPLWFWKISGRLEWFFNCPRQAEGRRKTRKRARRFAIILSKGNKDCLVVTHGFYMHTLIGEMKKAGFKVGRTGLKYKNGEYVVAEK